MKQITVASIETVNIIAKISTMIVNSNMYILEFLSVKIDVLASNADITEEEYNRTIPKSKSKRII
jgi:hypothetical protein